MHSDICMSRRREPGSVDVGLACYVHDHQHEGSQARRPAPPAGHGGPPGATRSPRAATDLGALGSSLQPAPGGARGPEARRAEAGGGCAAVALPPGPDPAGSGGAGGSARAATAVGGRARRRPAKRSERAPADTRESAGAARARYADADEAFALEVATVVEQVALGHLAPGRLAPYLADAPELVARAARVAGVVFGAEVTDDVMHEAAMAAERAHEVAVRAQDVARARKQSSARALERRRAGGRPRARAGRRPRARHARRAARARAAGDDPAPSGRRAARGPA